MDSACSTATCPQWVPIEHVHLGGQAVATASRAELTDAMAADCLAARAGVFEGGSRLVFDANGQGLSLKQTDPSYRDAINAADVVHADGGFLVTLSRWLAPKRIAERSATTDLIHDFAARAAADGLSFYLLGGTEEVNRNCAAELQRQYPGLVIAGRRNGFFEPGEEADVVSAIAATAPDILWVGLGKPKEQAFAVRNRTRLKAGWVVTCGGCFNFVVGAYRRAPNWMQKANLEWVHRMLSRPKQLLGRYLVTTPHALFLVLWRARTDRV